MSLHIDHLVLAVPGPDAAAAELEERLGLRATGGGRHDRLGTFNRIVWLGDSYLELIGVFDRALAERSWIGRPALRALERGGGLATWAIATNSMDAAVVAGMLAGLAVEGPIDGERARPDGRLVRWRLATLGPLGPGEPPFLIEHDPTAAEWTPEERVERQNQGHPIGGAVRLAFLDLNVPDPGGFAASLRGPLGSTFDDDIGTLTTGVDGQRLRLSAGNAEPLVGLEVSVAIRAREVEWLGCRFVLWGSDPPGDGEAVNRCAKRARVSCLDLGRP